MARVRGRVTTKTGADVQLDTSDEHPALTPVMRRVAGEYWEIVRARAAELMVDEAELYLVRAREKTSDLFSGEQVLPDGKA